MALGYPILKKKAPAVQQQEPWKPFRLAAFNYQKACSISNAIEQ